MLIIKGLLPVVGWQAFFVQSASHLICAVRALIVVYKGVCKMQKTPPNIVEIHLHLALSASKVDKI